MLSVLALGIRCGPELQEESAHAHLTIETALLVSERRDLQLCVELDPALEAQSAQVLSALKQDVAALAEAHPDWQSAGYGRAPVRVQRGCPDGALPSGRMEAKGAKQGPGLTSRPSPPGKPGQVHRGEGEKCNIGCIEVACNVSTAQNTKAAFRKGAAFMMGISHARCLKASSLYRFSGAKDRLGLE
jgi:hypothetical protein